VEREELKAKRREVAGKRVRFIRRQGMIPANLYGPNLESISLEIETAPLRRMLTKVGRNALINLKVDHDKKSRMVMVRDIQHDPLTDALLHVDFFQPVMTHKIKADVPLQFIGEAPAARSRRAIMIESMTMLHVEALPADLPRHIEVDLSVLRELEEAIHVRDIRPPEGVEILSDPDQVIVKVMEAKAEVVEEAAAAEAEVVGEEEAPAEEGAAPDESGAKARKREE